jgi:hypothetical protein
MVIIDLVSGDQPSELEARSELVAGAAKSARQTPSGTIRSSMSIAPRREESRSASKMHLLSV